MVSPPLSLYYLLPSALVLVALYNKVYIKKETLKKKQTALLSLTTNEEMR